MDGRTLTDWQPQLPHFSPDTYWAVRTLRRLAPAHRGVDMCLPAPVQGPIRICVRAHPHALAYGHVHTGCAHRGGVRTGVHIRVPIQVHTGAYTDAYTGAYT